MMSAAMVSAPSAAEGGGALRRSASLVFASALTLSSANAAHCTRSAPARAHGDGRVTIPMVAMTIMTIMTIMTRHGI
jgi:hypothetical protein